MGNRIGHQAALGVGLAAAHFDGDEFSRSLAIAHDGLRQILRHLGEQLQQRLAVAAIQRRDRRIARLAAGDDDEGVVRRGVAIDRDAVEGCIRYAARQLLHERGRHCRIGRQIAQHGRHIRADHARAFANARGADGAPANLCLCAMGFRHGVGGHDGL